MSLTSGWPALARASRRTRAIDAAALLLLVGGAAVYMYAEYRMGQLADGKIRIVRSPRAGGFDTVLVWEQLLTTSRVGLGLAIAGLVAGVGAFANHYRERRSALAHEQANDS